MEKLPVNKRLVHDLKQVIEQARSHVAATVNAAITLMYWHIGERINREMFGNERADYGKQIVTTLSRQLQELLGSKGFEKKQYNKNDEICRAFSRFCNCVASGDTIAGTLRKLQKKDSKYSAIV